MPSPYLLGVAVLHSRVQANIGEVLEGRYKVRGTSGRGVFSTVLICDDLVEEMSVAIKIIRGNDTMRRSGEKELELLVVRRGCLLRWGVSCRC